MIPDTALRNPEICTPTVEHAMGAAAASSVATTLKALAEPLRLRMLSAIATDPRGEACVCDLAELTEVSQPTVSHHLKVLKDNGLRMLRANRIALSRCALWMLALRGSRMNWPTNFPS